MSKAKFLIEKILDIFLKLVKYGVMLTLAYVIVISPLVENLDTFIEVISSLIGMDSSQRILYILLFAIMLFAVIYIPMLILSLFVPKLKKLAWSVYHFTIILVMSFTAYVIYYSGYEDEYWWIIAICIIVCLSEFTEILGLRKKKENE